MILGKYAKRNTSCKKSCFKRLHLSINIVIMKLNESHSYETSQNKKTVL